MSPALGMERKYGCCTFLGGGGISANFLQIYTASFSRSLSISSVTKLDARLPHYLFGFHTINTNGQEELSVTNFRYRVDVGGQG